MATIYRARMPGAFGFEKIVVIKRIHKHLLGDQHTVQMLVDEAKIAARVHHPNVVQVFELGESDDHEFYICMEYVQGVDLKALLEAADRRGVRLPAWFGAHLANQVLE